MRRVTLRQSSDSTSPEASACGDQVQNMVTPENENEKILAGNVASFFIGLSVVNDI